MTCPLDEAGCRVPTIVRRWFSRSSCSGVKRVSGEDGREGGARREEGGGMSILCQTSLTVSIIEMVINRLFQ